MPRLRSRVRDSSPAPDFQGSFSVCPCFASVCATTVVQVCGYNKFPRRGSKVVMQRPAKPSTPVRFRPPPPVFQKSAACAFFACAPAKLVALCPSGEIGRHSGLKIRRLPERGRTGSIPVSGTNISYHLVSNHLKTRIVSGFVSFLLSNPVSGSGMRYQHFDGVFFGVFLKSRKARYQQRR